MASTKNFLGRGWSFPPAFNRDLKEVEMVEARQDIEQSLEILLSTSLGERVLQPEYGCNLSDLQFDPVNSSFIGYLRSLVSDAILYHEARIRVERIDISEASADLLEGRLQIGIEYTIRGTNSRFNYVYDFYVREGVN
ncbi:MAG: GPW/gp25 family protein [Saprospiraceae bacterium]|nr:GPW/gp25 family protein [Saprospiraceae bacterium]